MKTMNIYLAGPDVFRPEQKIAEVSKLLKATCEAYGFEGHFPLDNALAPDDGNLRSEAFSLKIFRANITMIDRCDAIVANLENFRGPNVDDGTAFEIGYGFALKKRIYGYSALCGMNYRQIFEKYAEHLSEQYRKELRETFPVVEDFETGMANLMITGAIHDSGGRIFQSFEDCVAHLAENRF